MSIAKYFSQLKRPRSSASSSDSESETFSTPSKQPSRTQGNQDSKRTHFEEVWEEEEDSFGADMSAQEILNDINAKLATVATKEDIQNVQQEVKSLTSTFMEKIEKLEGRLFEVEARREQVDKEVASLKKRERGSSPDRETPGPRAEEAGKGAEQSAPVLRALESSGLQGARTGG